MVQRVRRPQVLLEAVMPMTDISMAKPKNTTLSPML